MAIVVNKVHQEDLERFQRLCENLEISKKEPNGPSWDAKERVERNVHPYLLSIIDELIEARAALSATSGGDAEPVVADKIAAIRQRLAATPGLPWAVNKKEQQLWSPSTEQYIGTEGTISDPEINFMVNASQDISYLLSLLTAAPASAQEVLDEATLGKLQEDVLYNLTNGPVFVDLGTRWVPLKTAVEVLGQLAKAGVDARAGLRTQAEELKANLAAALNTLNLHNATAVSSTEREKPGGGWVPVSERLPEPGVPVLICEHRDDCPIHIAEYLPDEVDEEDEDKWEYDYGVWGRPSFWMPLPAQPVAAQQALCAKLKDEQS